MPIQAVEQVKRVHLIKILMNQYRAPEIRKILQEEYNINTKEETINQDIKEIQSGKYNNFLDDLIEVHFPQIYSDVLGIVKEDMDSLIEIANNTKSEKIRMGATVSHARLAFDYIRVLHQAPVIRQMKLISIQAKRLARDVMSKGDLRRVAMPIDEQIEHNVITLNANLEQIENEIENDENPKGSDEN